MTKKRKKLEAALEKMRKRKAALEARIGEMEDLITEEKNTEIQDMIHKANVTPEQLAEILKALEGHALQGSFPVTEEGEDMADEA